ncbi:DegV family protein [Micrococcus sp. M4NT]|uniref:DegV family protein n=1 Tax=Micrococcus sp. M4NT TaxID=2957501 RepID=UPI002610DCEB|nr:DegV family protein [Micrococcus sp. M4NT]MDX2340419.1 DegV family protein [Micrococcus sp. M4NT]
MATLDQWRDDVLERLRARRPHLVGRARYGLKPPRRDRTAIVTDSAAALPPALLAHPLAAGIRQVTLPVMVGEQIHTEGTEDLRFELPVALASGTPVKTSRPSPGAFRAVYADLAQAGYARVLSLHLSSRLSGTVEAARLAAADAPRPVTVLDSGTAGFALGLTVLDAAIDAGVGLPVEQITARAEATAQAGAVLFSVPSLEQLRRGGRIGAVASLLGTLLHVRPVLALDDGAVTLVDRPRSAARAMDRIVELALERAAGKPSRIVVHGFGDPAGSEELVARLQPHSATPVPVVELPAVLAAHLGLGALGVVVTPLEVEVD